MTYIAPEDDAPYEQAAQMASESPVRVTVELTFPGGKTVQFQLDDTDEPISFSLNVENDIWESQNTIVPAQIPGDRRRVDFRIAGRGPIKVPAVAP